MGRASLSQLSTITSLYKPFLGFRVELIDCFTLLEGNSSHFKKKSTHLYYQDLRENDLMEDHEVFKNVFYIQEFLLQLKRNFGTSKLIQRYEFLTP